MDLIPNKFTTRYGPTQARNLTVVQTISRRTRTFAFARSGTRLDFAAESHQYFITNQLPSCYSATATRNWCGIASYDNALPKTPRTAASSSTEPPHAGAATTGNTPPPSTQRTGATVSRRSWCRPCATTIGGGPRTTWSGPAHAQRRTTEGSPQSAVANRLYLIRASRSTMPPTRATRSAPNYLSSHLEPPFAANEQSIPRQEDW
jgi:hypothetical protein